MQETYWLVALPFIVIGADWFFYSINDWLVKKIGTVPDWWV